MQSTRKNEADGDDQENRNDTRYDFHWPLTPFPKSQLPFGYFRCTIQARIAAIE
ncbi:hypothetical protein OS035_27860 [Rhizobium sp. 268]|uniref:hypothetical protein n=1 Tax=unclassified Rhizobium TaxID=2613769 RepID=UPI00160BAB0D|nr:hypothetical protein [Rhizobium sp. BK456]MBB3522306.1 hypothetical protein [Rhizobium sp. BK456]